MIRAVLWSLLGATAVVSSAAAQSEPIVFAVLPFEDRGSYGQDKQVFRALELGIPSALAVEVGKQPGVRVADRSRIGRALKSENLDPDARVDAATAARVGREAGARYAITGNFADFYGKFRVDARLIDVKSGQILKVISNNDPSLQDRADLSRILRDLAGRLMNAASVPGSESAGSSSQEGLVPTEALTQYSLGLLYEGEGDRTKAGEHYRRALTAFPNYAEAREGMQRVR